MEVNEEAWSFVVGKMALQFLIIFS